MMWFPVMWKTCCLIIKTFPSWNIKLTYLLQHVVAVWQLCITNDIGSVSHDHCPWCHVWPAGSEKWCQGGRNIIQHWCNVAFSETGEHMSCSETVIDWLQGSHKPGKPGIVGEFCKPGKVREFTIWSGNFFYEISHFSRVAYLWVDLCM